MSPRPSGTTLRQYADHLRATGVAVYQGSSQTYWAAFADRVALRLPTFHVGMAAQSEVDAALRSTGALIASHLTAPDDDHPANAWLYLCADGDYALRTRTPAMQRNVRRALRELRIAPLTLDEVLVHGVRAFCDTRQRNGLDDGSPRGFRRYVEAHLDRPGRAHLGAWRHGQLAAFVTIVSFDDWAELASFSVTGMLRYRPNDALLYTALSTHLRPGRCRVISFGVSSLEADSNIAGLHRFKRKVGFDAIPVHRAFSLHPGIRPLASRPTLTAAHWTVRAALRLRPRNRVLKKLEGMFAFMLGATSMMRAATRGDGAGRVAPALPRESVCTG